MTNEEIEMLKDGLKFIMCDSEEEAIKMFTLKTYDVAKCALEAIETLQAENERLKQTNEEWNQYIPFLYAHGFFHEVEE